MQRSFPMYRFQQLPEEWCAYFFSFLGICRHRVSRLEKLHLVGESKKKRRSVRACSSFQMYRVRLSVTHGDHKQRKKYRRRRRSHSPLTMSQLRLVRHVRGCCGEKTLGGRVETLK